MRNSKPEVQVMKIDILSSSWNDCYQQLILNSFIVRSALRKFIHNESTPLFLCFVQHHPLFLGEGSKHLKKVTERTSLEIKKIWSIFLIQKILIQAHAIHLLPPMNVFCRQKLNNPALLKGSPNPGSRAWNACLCSWKTHMHEKHWEPVLQEQGLTV